MINVYRAYRAYRWVHRGYLRRRYVAYTVAPILINWTTR